MHCQGHCRAGSSLQPPFHQELKRGTTFQPADPQSASLVHYIQHAGCISRGATSLFLPFLPAGFSPGGLYYERDVNHWDQTELSKRDNDKTEKSRNQSNVFFTRAYRTIIQNACIPPCLCTENNQEPQPKDPYCKAGSFSIFTKKVLLSASKWTKHIIKIRVLACAKPFLNYL